MMTRSGEKQCRLLAVTMEELIPQDHFLRKLDAAISFDFVYEIVSPLYSAQGRPSIDPVILVKMLLLGYLYGIDSERKLAEEVRYNIAYRWYLGLDLDDPTPDHSTFSQNRRRRFKGREVFRQIFDRIVAKCWEAGLVKGESVVMDSTHIKANADTHNNVTIEVTRRPKAYWDDLNQTVLPEETIEKVRNPCDPDAGYMNRTGKPKGFHYLDHQCSDADTGIILDVSVTGGDVQDCECCVERYKYLKEDKHYPIQSAGLDSGYDTIRIHYGLARLGITAYIRPCRRGNRKECKWFTQDDFIWVREENKFICPAGKDLLFRGVSRQRSGPPLLTYATKNRDCNGCTFRGKCFTPKKRHRVILKSVLSEYQDAGRLCIGTASYRQILRKRQVVCEGNFGLQKRCHNLRFTRKRGIENVEEQCLLSASALNLKRLIKGITGMKDPLAEEPKSLLSKWIYFFLGLYSFKILLCQQTHVAEKFSEDSPRKIGFDKIVKPDLI